MRSDNTPLSGLLRGTNVDEQLLANSETFADGRYAICQARPHRSPNIGHANTRARATRVCLQSRGSGHLGDPARGYSARMDVRFAGLPILVAAVCCLTAGPAAAQVYRCVGLTGATLYTDSPCPKGSAQAHEITAEVGSCTTAGCVARREAEAKAARLRLLDEKAELARLLELRIRQEEAWARVIAAQRTAEAAAEAYAPPREEVVIGAAYPAWFAHRPFLFRHHPRHAKPDPRSLPTAGPLVRRGDEPIQRINLGRPGFRLRVSVDG